MDKTYKNKSGTIYKLDSKPFLENQTNWPSEVVAFNRQKVVEEYKVNNIYEKIIEFEEKGLLVIYRYPNKPEDLPNNKDLIEKYIKYYINGRKDIINDLLKEYPEFSEEVKKRISEIESKNK